MKKVQVLVGSFVVVVALAVALVLGLLAGGGATHATSGSSLNQSFPALDGAHGKK